MTDFRVRIARYSYRHPSLCISGRGRIFPELLGQSLVRTPSRILIVDDNPTNVKVLQTRLAAEGYEVLTAADGEEGLAAARQHTPDLILLDVMMPKLDGFEVCRRLRADAAFPFTPIIMVTAMADSKDVIAGLEAGGDEYLTNPVDPAGLHDTVETLAAEVKEWNASLERRVAAQVGELERVGRLRRFFSPQLAELIVNGGAEDPLKSHRREITVVFLDLRGFTAFAEVAEPEEVMGVLREYHQATGKLILEYEGTLEHFTGDGITILFNDPMPIPNPNERAVRMALAIRERVGRMAKDWVKRGYELSLGIGIAQGFATIGAIGFEGRWDYSAIGTVTNLAARLCGEVPGDQILIAQRVYAGVETLVEVEPQEVLTLKGFRRPVIAYRVRRLKTPRS
ncbi:MAG: response regulator [Betaproteobacteria bacterium]|nr:MAG: response regulator [Betaproteobacteria bacterium]